MSVSGSSTAAGTARSQLIPPRMRLLCVAAEQPSWVSLALALDGVGCHEPVFRWVSTASEAFVLLRNESFDCVILQDTEDAEVVALLQGVRATGCHEPVLVLLSNLHESVQLAAWECDAEVLVSELGWKSLLLVPSLHRLLERATLQAENHRLAVLEHRRLARDRDEADHLLHQQQQILRDVERLARSAGWDAPEAEEERFTSSPETTSPLNLPVEFDRYYQELLRAYVIMGSGNLAGDIAKLAELLALAGYTPRQALQLHLCRVEQLVRGLGNRSTRHVMSRADLLALELLIHLGDCYQRAAAQRK